ncbi:hypothetical protein JJL56_11535 [Azospirillum sp. YIM DDC1]|uniref:Uncharacterized protein n=1 Tax=Azospirillum aestuarii TaxID=2802052 RepID=A0ABS1HXG3_9PROT|nr:hypothetical protein [Azospirillum aestuarii]MBK4719504.1 hypothetical protein [Azospirillum aestuarii]
MEPSGIAANVAADIIGTKTLALFDQMNRIKREGDAARGLCDRFEPITSQLVLTVNRKQDHNTVRGYPQSTSKLVIFQNCNSDAETFTCWRA